MATQAFEFQHQSLKQKLVLVSAKALVLIGTSLSVYVLGWGDQTDLGEQLRAVGSIFIGFWIYVNLLRVKTEIQELFIPPVDIGFAKELMIIGSVIFTASYFFW